MDKNAAKAELKLLLERYEKILREPRLIKSKEEAMTKKDLIRPLFERVLGWHFEEDVTEEERVSKGWVDYSFRINEVAKFFLEAKGLNVDLDNRDFFQQAVSYAYYKGCSWAILTNFEVIEILNAEWEAPTYYHSHVMTIRCNEFLTNFDDLWLLSRDSFEKGLLDVVAEKYSKKSKRIRFDKQLLEDFTEFRGMLSKNITKLNSSKRLTEEALDESIQRILNRLIFIRYCEDRGLEEKKLWEAKNENKVGKKLREVFAYYDEHYDSKLFTFDLIDPKKVHLCDTLEIDDYVWREIITGLYLKDASVSYDFSLIDADVLGTVYEQYLSHILKKTEKRAKLSQNQIHRKEQGIYYTPIFVVDYIVRNAIGEILKDKKMDTEKIRVLDLACGSGSFLIKAFDVLNEHFRKNLKEYSQTKLDLETNLPFKRKAMILQNNIFGVDLDKQAVEIAQLNLLLKIAEQRHRLPMLEQNIKCGNSLIDKEEIAGDKAFKWKEQFEKILDNGKFDVIVGNPPYVRMQALNKVHRDYFYDNYESAKQHFDISNLFVEKGLELLREGGVLGLILQAKFFNADYGVGLRELITKKKALMQILDFKDFQIFDGATTYTCLLFLKKGKNKDFKYCEIVDEDKLVKTKTISPKNLKCNVQKQPEGSNAWSFGANDCQELLNKLKKVKFTLNDVSEDIFQGFLSGRDKLFFVRIIEDKGSIVKVRNTLDDCEHSIEKALLKKLLKGKEIKKWYIDWRDAHAIYPYEEIDGTTQLIPIEKLKSDYPNAYRYFLTYKKQLMDSETTEAVTEANFYRFRRARSKYQFEHQKILTQVLSKHNSFTLDDKGEFYFVGGGTAGGFSIIVKKEYAKDVFVLLALLNSQVLEFFLKKISTPFQHGFYAYGKKFIETFPIIIPSGNDWNKLDDLSRKQLSRAKKLIDTGKNRTDETATLENQIKDTDNEINEIAFKIYDLTEEEKEIVKKNI